MLTIYFSSLIFGLVSRRNYAEQEAILGRCVEIQSSEGWSVKPVAKRRVQATIFFSNFERHVVLRSDVCTVRSAGVVFVLIVGRQSSR